MDLNITDLISHIEFLISLDDDYREIDDFGLLKNDEKSSLKIYSNLPNKKWNQEIYNKVLFILQKYKNEIPDFSICLDNIEPCINRIKLSYIDGKIKFSDINDLVISNFGNPLCNKNNIYNFNDINLSSILKIKNDFKFDKSFLNFLNIQLNMHNIKIDNNFFENKNIKKIPLNYQKYGILFGLFNKKIILGDDMGLGKSLQSLITCELTNQFPCLIVCPSSLIYNWQKEINETLNRTSYILKNKKNIKKSDFYIINYESIHKYSNIIKDLNINFIIFDESHYLKNKKARRTKVSLDIAKQSEYIIALTGTPILTKPKELITQLELIGKLDDLGGYWGYTSNYCDSKETSWGFDDSGNSNLDLLSKNLRTTCFIRREKKDVLSELPQKRRTILPIEIDNKEEYRIIDSLYKKTIDKSIKQFYYHERNKIIAKGKINQMKNLVSDFIDSDQKIIIFALYNDTINLLKEIYPNELFITEDKTVEERFNISKEFQTNVNKKIIICSINIANAGFDLFAASNILFLEFSSVDEINCQCEDRSYRLGQEFSVNSWILKGISTYDERKIELVNNRKEITKNIKTSHI